MCRVSSGITNHKHTSQNIIVTGQYESKLRLYSEAIVHFVKKCTKLTGCVHFDTSMNIRYAGICEINTESQKYKISDILM